MNLLKEYRLLFIGLALGALLGTRYTQWRWYTHGWPIGAIDISLGAGPNRIDHLRIKERMRILIFGYDGF